MTAPDLPLDEAAANIQRARDRALLISQQDSDAPKLTQRLDAQAMATLVAGFDALRARVAELEKENTTIRALLVKYECPYGEKSLGECSRGFPGCACADDMLATASWCPEDEDKAAVRLGRRVAELEQERASMCNDIAARVAENFALQATANVLRDALEDALADLRNYSTMCTADNLEAALAAHPAASLAAHDAEVLERCLSAVRAVGLTRGWHEDRAGFDHGQEWMRQKVEDAIRALAAQEVTK